MALSLPKVNTDNLNSRVTVSNLSRGNTALHLELLDITVLNQANLVSLVKLKARVSTANNPSLDHSTVLLLAHLLDLDRLLREAMDNSLKASTVNSPDRGRGSMDNNLDKGSTVNNPDKASMVNSRDRVKVNMASSQDKDKDNTVSNPLKASTDNSPDKVNTANNHPRVNMANNPLHLVEGV